MAGPIKTPRMAQPSSGDLQSPSLGTPRAGQDIPEWGEAAALGAHSPTSAPEHPSQTSLLQKRGQKSQAGPEDLSLRRIPFLPPYR